MAFFPLAAEGPPEPWYRSKGSERSVFECRMNKALLEKPPFPWEGSGSGIIPQPHDNCRGPRRVASNFVRTSSGSPKPCSGYVALMSNRPGGSAIVYQ